MKGEKRRIGKGKRGKGRRERREEKREEERKGVQEIEPLEVEEKVTINI